MNDFFFKFARFILWSLLYHVGCTSGGYCYSYYYYSYYYCNTAVWSVGAIVGAIIGGIFFFVILCIIMVVVCSACKTQGNRGTVVQPVHHTTIQTVNTGQQQPSQYGHPPPQYNQYPPPHGGNMYPPSQNMAYPPMGGHPGQPNSSSGFTYNNQPPPYPGAATK